MRPVDGAALPDDKADIIASAPSGKLRIDGQPIQSDEPFPNVFHALVKVSPGAHVLSLSWDGGKKEIRFFSGPNPPDGFAPFHQHPPIPNIPCTQCHAATQTGRFRFKGGCFDCHPQDSFPKVHTHNDTILIQCGKCHNAHGSTVKAHLTVTKEVACKLCHE
jgi:predicted CXXCH cytochrome family protein